MEKVVIVGAGFIGQAVARNFISKSIRPKILDRGEPPADISDSVDWVSGDYHDHNVISRALEGASIVFHLVSSTVPGDQNTNNALELTENVLGAVDLLDACVGAGVKKVFFASSASVYGMQNHMPINELAETNPISSHGIQKLMIEKYFLLAQFQSRIDVQIARIANPYGPGQALFGRQGFIAIVLGKIKRNEPIGLRDEGKAIRDFIYIDDLAEAVVQCSLKSCLPSIINIGSGEGCSLGKVLSVISSLTGRVLDTVPVTSRMVDIPESILDIGLMQSRLGFSAMTSLHDGISQTLLANGLSLKSS